VVRRCIEFVLYHGKATRWWLGSIFIHIQLPSFSGLHSEGIYRVNGNTHHVDKLISRFNKSPEKFNMRFPKYDEFDVASAFKKFIRDLPKPLIGDLTNDFVKATRKYCGV